MEQLTDPKVQISKWIQNSKVILGSKLVRGMEIFVRMMLSALCRLAPSGEWSSTGASCFKRDLNEPKSISGTRFGGHIASEIVMGHCCRRKPIREVLQ